MKFAHSSIDADANLYVLSNETQHYGSFMIMRPETQKILMDSFDSVLKKISQNNKHILTKGITEFILNI